VSAFIGGPYRVRADGLPCPCVSWWHDTRLYG
jgi:hypothetical protein